MREQTKDRLLWSFAGLLSVVAICLALAGCALGPAPRIAPLPAEVAGADANVLAVAGNLQQLLTMTARVVDAVSRIEDEAARNGVVPASADAAFDRAMLAYVEASLVASKGLVGGATKSWAELKALVQPVLVRGQMLIDTAYQIGAVRTKASAFLGQVRDLLSSAAREFAMGGTR